MTARTPQGAIAWAISLISFPYVSLPLFWIFGRDRFRGYVGLRSNEDLKIEFLRQRENTHTLATPVNVDACTVKVFEELAGMRFRMGNDAKLCINGKATFDAIFEAIDSAKEYLLVQFFIVEDDTLGREFKSKLIEAALRGVRISFLYDEIGSHALPRSYVKELVAASVDIRPFKTTKGAFNRFQLNFRNHRKIVIADGKVALVGGHNVGDAYLGKDKKLGFWRDTHVRLEGPAVAQVQVSFMEDWHWSSDAVPALNWNLDSTPTSGKTVLVLPSGPADNADTCSLFFLEAINAAKHRVWITSPYFVPDIQIVSALQLAAMRGVDVRILLPSRMDHLMVYMASFSYLKDTIPWNIKMYRYQNGFLHEKVILIDEHLSTVGTANFDNRSFRLNFEITLIFADRDFNQQVEEMLLEDFTSSKLISMSDFESRPFFFKLAVVVARLMAPIL